jgi:Fe-S cluster assembly ATP-binding protein
MHERTKGMILIISHQERILNIADKIVVLAGGEVVDYGKREEVFPKLMDVRSGCNFTKNS